MLSRALLVTRYDLSAIMAGLWSFGLMMLVVAAGSVAGCLQAGNPSRPAGTAQSNEAKPQVGVNVTPTASQESNPTVSVPTISGPIARPPVTPGTTQGGAGSSTPAPVWKPGDPVQERQDLRRSN